MQAQKVKLILTLVNRGQENFRKFVDIHRRVSSKQDISVFKGKYSKPTDWLDALARAKFEKEQVKTREAGIINEYF